MGNLKTSINKRKFYLARFKTRFIMIKRIVKEFFYKVRSYGKIKLLNATLS